jgi:RimJ/RimL family protein N-acetyltransferase
MQIPLLSQTTGCRFRKMELHDAPRILEIHTDIETRRFTRLLRQQSLSDIISWLNYYPHYRRHGFGLWAIEHNDSGLLAGLCGLRVRKDLSNQIDLSYRLHPEFRGKGIATDAVKTCVEWGFLSLKLPSILAQVHRDNTISMHILSKLGFNKTKENGIWTDLIKKSPFKTEIQSG